MRGGRAFRTGMAMRLQAGLQALGRALVLMAGLGLALPPAATMAVGAPSLVAVVLCTGDGPRLVRLPRDAVPPGEAPAEERHPRQHCIFCLQGQSQEPALPAAEAPALLLRARPRPGRPARRRPARGRHAYLLPRPRAPPGGLCRRDGTNPNRLTA